MSNQRRAGVVLGYVNILAKNLVNLVYTPMLLSFVGQADYGVYQTSNSFVFSLALLSFGFSQAYVRFYTHYLAEGTEADVRRLNGVYLVLYSAISVVALLLGLAFAAGAGAFFSESFTPEQVGLARAVMSVMAASISVTLFNSVFDAYVLAHEEFRFQQSRQLFTTLATPFIAYALLALGMGVVGVAAAQLAVNFVLLVLNASYCLRRLGMRFDLRCFDGALFRSIAMFSAWIFANQVCELINQNIPNIVLGAVSGAVAVSVFAVSVQIRSVFYSLSTTISNVFVPLVNRIVAETNDNAELTCLMTRVGRYQAILYMWVLGGFALLGRFFITAWAGPGFGDAYWLILAMVTPLFVPLVQNIGIEIQKAKNMHRARSVCYLVMAAINLALTAVLAPFIGCWAPAIGYIAYVVFGCGLFMNWYYHCRVDLNMAHFWRCVLPVVVAGALASVLCMAGAAFLPVSDWGSFIAWGLAYSVVYASFCGAIVLEPSERHIVVDWIKRLFSRIRSCCFGRWGNKQKED